MAQRVRIVYPKNLKERIRGRIRDLMPDLYGRAHVLVVRRDDRRDRRVQRQLFRQLPAFADTPSDIEDSTPCLCACARSQEAERPDRPLP